MHQENLVIAKNYYVRNLYVVNQSGVSHNILFFSFYCIIILWLINYTTFGASGSFFIHCLFFQNTKNYDEPKNDDGRNVKVISFEDFLAIIDLTTDKIKQLKMPVVPKRKTKKKKVYSTGSNSYTIGDQLRAQGIDLTKL